MLGNSLSECSVIGYKSSLPYHRYINAPRLYLSKTFLLTALADSDRLRRSITYNYKYGKAKWSIEMSIVIQEVKTPAQMKEFIYLPEKVNAGRKNWVPPFYADDARSFDSKRNPSHAYCEMIYALAYQDGKAVGRIAGIINKRLNERQGTKVGRFGYYDAIDSFEVTEALVKFAEAWAKAKGMTKIVGPMGFTEEDPEGFMTEGFDEVPSLASFENLPSVPGYIERLGYGKEVDYVVYQVEVKKAKTEFYGKMFKRVERNPDLILKNLTKTSELRPYILPIFKLMNDAFTHLYGYSTFEEHEMQDLANRYISVVDPKFIKTVVNAAGEVIGFIVAIPNMADGIRKARGRMFPFGFLSILAARKKSKILDLYMGAIKESYRGKGVDVLLGYSLLETCANAGIEYWDSHHELENNAQVRAEMERAQGRIYKRFRIFGKEL